MNWEKPTEELIRERRSCRTFDERKIEPEKLDKLKSFIEQSNNQVKQMRFAIFALDAGGKIGTYGMISGARTFIAGIVEKNRENIEELGMAFEKIVLFATSLGLGTCWLAGIDRKTFIGKINLAENEVIAVASPVGYALKPRLKEGLARMVIGADKRKPWEDLFFLSEPGTVLPREKAGAFAQALEMARWAPSASNRQPWRVVYEGTKFYFCLVRNPGYGVEQPFDIQKSDIGIAMCHFELTAGAGKWTFDPTVHFKEPFVYIKTWEASAENNE
jgi:nitroreductase